MRCRGCNAHLRSKESGQDLLQKSFVCWQTWLCWCHSPQWLQQAWGVRESRTKLQICLTFFVCAEGFPKWLCQQQLCTTTHMVAHSCRFILSFRNANHWGHDNGFMSARRQVFPSKYFSLWTGQFADEVDKGGLVTSDSWTTLVTWGTKKTCPIGLPLLVLWHVTTHIAVCFIQNSALGMRLKHKTEPSSFCSAALWREVRGQALQAGLAGWVLSPCAGRAMCPSPRATVRTGVHGAMRLAGIQSRSQGMWLCKTWSL